MWKSVKLHFPVNTNSFDFLKVNNFFHGLYSYAEGIKSNNAGYLKTLREKEIHPNRNYKHTSFE